MKLPRKLRISPLVEAIFELRFSPAQSAAGDLLPGILFQAFPGDYSEVESLPVSGVPLEIRESDPNLRYQALHRLQGKQRSLSTGNRVIVYSSQQAYPGKTKFLQEIGTVLAKVQKTKLVSSVERFSFRYINLLSAEIGAQLKLLNATLKMKGGPISEKGFQLRFEEQDGDFLSIVKVHTNATVAFKDGVSRTGLLLDVDTLYSGRLDEFWPEKDSLLAQGHASLKKTFFSMLTDEAISACDPDEGTND